jgi:hypothetical protein
VPHFVNDGLALHYEVHGEGAPVVLLHGGAVSFERNYAMFGWIERLNERGFQVVGLDFRGHGGSDKPHDAAPCGSAKLASDVLGRGPRLAGALGRGRYLEVADADHFSLAADGGVQAAIADFLAGGEADREPRGPAVTS